MYSLPIRKIHIASPAHLSIHTVYTCITVLFLQLRNTDNHYWDIPCWSKVHLYNTSHRLKGQNQQFRSDSDWIWKILKMWLILNRISKYSRHLLLNIIKLFSFIVHDVYKRFHWELFITRNTVNQKTGVNGCSHLLSW